MFYPTSHTISYPKASFYTHTHTHTHREDHCSLKADEIIFNLSATVKVIFLTFPTKVKLHYSLIFPSKSMPSFALSQLLESFICS